MPLFEAKRLHKRFGAHVVLEDVSMRFEEGRLSGIMGPNGAGKTTCFNLLTGRYAPDRGSVSFEGRDITGQPPRRIARLGISRSFQIMNLFDDYSALDNVLVASPEMRQRGFSMLRVFGGKDLEEKGKPATTYQIVGDDEADIKQGRISINSPIARALIGKETGDIVDAQTPGGVKQYEILDIRYG